MADSLPTPPGSPLTLADARKALEAQLSYVEQSGIPLHATALYRERMSAFLDDFQAFLSRAEADTNRANTAAITAGSTARRAVITAAYPLPPVEIPAPSTGSTPASDSADGTNTPGSTWEPST